MNTSQKRNTFSGTGAVSILLVFVILCLVAFGVLACTTAQADLTYARQNAQRTSAYYAASTQAEEHLARLNTALLSAWDEPSQAYAPEWEETLPAPWSIEDGVLSLTVSIGDTKALIVTAEQQPPQDGCCYRLLGYQTENTQPWQPDDSLNLLG